MKILGVIPARYASTRFPGKPLISIHGKTMIQRVYEQVKKSTRVSDVVIATDDHRICKHVEGFGGQVEMTDVNHQSGTDRCAEVAKKYSGYEAIINIQGDEPFIDPIQIDLLCDSLVQSDAQIVTLIKKIQNFEELVDYNIPKVVFDNHLNALFFSRQVIPYFNTNSQKYDVESSSHFKHIGIYGFRRNTLLGLSNLPVSKLEKVERLEQLRWLESGYKIHLVETTLENQSVDCPEDLIKIKQIYRH